MEGGLKNDYGKRNWWRGDWLNELIQKERDQEN